MDRGENEALLKSSLDRIERIEAFLTSSRKVSRGSRLDGLVRGSDRDDAFRVLAVERKSADQGFQEIGVTPPDPEASRRKAERIRIDRLQALTIDQLRTRIQRLSRVVSDKGALDSAALFLDHAHFEQTRRARRILEWRNR